MKILYVLIITALIGVAGFFLWPTTPESDVTSVASSISQDPPDTKFIGSNPEPHATPSSASMVSVELSRWNESHGYLHDLNSNNPYSGYGFSQLMELAEQGDIEAIYQVSASTILYKKNYKKGLSLLTDAAVRGSTLVLVRTGNHYINDQLPSAVEGQNNNLLAATYYLAADLRGDPAGTKMVNVALKKASIDQNSQDDLDSVCQAALDLLEDFSERRNQLGLGDFDNSRKPGDTRGFHPICSR